MTASTWISPRPSWFSLVALSGIALLLVKVHRCCVWKHKYENFNFYTMLMHSRITYLVYGLSSVNLLSFMNKYGPFAGLMSREFSENTKTVLTFISPWQASKFADKLR